MRLYFLWRREGDILYWDILRGGAMISGVTNERWLAKQRALHIQKGREVVEQPWSTFMKHLEAQDEQAKLAWGQTGPVELADLSPVRIGTSPTNRGQPAGSG